MTKPHLLAIGGALIDRRGAPSGPFVKGASNPGTMREEIGGAAFNSARAAARLGAQVAMMTVRGGDHAGQAVADAIATAGISDRSSVHLDRATPSYTAILDGQGELTAAIADMALYDAGFPKLVRRSATRSAIAEADAMLLDANLPESAIFETISQAGKTPVFANAVSPAKIVRFRPSLAKMTCLFMNIGEAETIAGAAGAGAADLVAGLRKAGLRSGIITSGEKAILFFDEADAFTLQPPAVEIGDVTGAGDALAGATIAALMASKPLAEAVRHGAAAAAIVTGSAEVAPDFSHDSFAEMLDRVGKAQPLRRQTQDTS